MRMRWLTVFGGMIATVGLASAASAQPWVRIYPGVRVPGRAATVTTVGAVRVARGVAVRPIRRGMYYGLPRRTAVVYPLYVPRPYVGPLRRTTVVVNTPAVIASSAVPSNALPSAAPTVGGEITIINPAATGGTVQFRLGDQALRLASGYEQGFSNAVGQIVAFDRGGNFGTARYTLTGAVYEFQMTPKGWDLLKKAAAGAAETPPASGESSILKNALP